MPLAEIQRKLCDLTTPASKLSEIEEMLEVLADIASSWCEIMMTADEEYYFHVHLKVPVSEAKKAIQAAMNELQEDWMFVLTEGEKLERSFSKIQN